jgi:hypothetical protein
MAVMNVCIQSAITDACKVAMRYLLLSRRCAAPCPARGIDGRLLSQSQRCVDDELGLDCG